MTDKHFCVALYLNNTLAAEAFSRLQFAGFGMNQLSFIGRDYWTNTVGSHSTRDSFKYCGNLAPFWERLWSVLDGRGVFWSYENGPMLVAGPLAQEIVAAQNGGSADKGASDFETGLSGNGIPMESIIQYEKALNKDQILLFVCGTMGEVNHAHSVLSETKAINHTLHYGAGDYLSLKRDAGSAS